MWNSGLDETLADVKIAGRNKKPQIYRWYHSNDRKWRGTLEPPNEVKEESEKADLKLSTQNTKIMVSSPITSWQIDGEKWKQWQILFWGAPKSLQMGTAVMKLKDTPWKKNYKKVKKRKPRQHIKK